MHQWAFSILLFVLFPKVHCTTKPPNIIIIQADDMGYNDVSFHGSSEIPTPNIDALAYNGVILNRFYTPPMCTPSRASLLTGKYPFRIGMQHYVIVSDEPWGLGLDQKLMPQYFKEAGYKTNLIGKWHLGFFNETYMPNHRGFDSFFGYMGPYVDYFDYTLKMFSRNYSRGYDMRRNLSIEHEIFPKPYATNLFTNEAVKMIIEHDKNDPLFLLINHLAPHAANDDFPLQAPEEEIEKFNYIKDPSRRTLAAMISIMDRGIGDIIEALQFKRMLENSIVIFYSDNGAPTLGMHATTGSNYPFRGQKQTPWEGGVRTVGLVYSPLIQKPARVINELFHITDLLPTLLSFTKIKPKDLDGYNQWPMISRNRSSDRYEIVNNLDPMTGFVSYILENFKLVNDSSSNGQFDGWMGTTTKSDNDEEFLDYAKKVLESKAANAIGNISINGRNQLNLDQIRSLRSEATLSCSINKTNYSDPCDLRNGPCLFNIVEDPCEQNNLRDHKDPIMFQYIQRKLQKWMKKIVKPRNKPADPNCDPSNFNYTWSSWK